MNCNQTYLMTDVLEYCTNILFKCLLSQKQVLYLTHRAIFSIVHKVIPRARVTIEHRLCLNMLPSVRLAPLTLECIVRIASCSGMVLK